MFQNDILEGAKNICDLNRISRNYAIDSIYDILTDGFVFPPADIVIGRFPCNDLSYAGKRSGFNSVVLYCTYSTYVPYSLSPYRVLNSDTASALSLCSRGTSLSLFSL